MGIGALAVDALLPVLQLCWRRGGFGVIGGNWGDFTFLARFLLVTFLLAAAVTVYWCVRGFHALFDEPEVARWPGYLLGVWAALHLWGLLSGIKMLLTVWPYI